jgi:soluble cytochrome b562
MDKYTQAMQEKVANIVEWTNNQEGQLIETMDNIDLLPNEKQLQEQLACASLFNQVNSYMESCNVA